MKSVKIIFILILTLKALHRSVHHSVNAAFYFKNMSKFLIAIFGVRIQHKCPKCELGHSSYSAPITSVIMHSICYLFTPSCFEIMIHVKKNVARLCLSNIINSIQIIMWSLWIVVGKRLELKYLSPSRASWATLKGVSTWTTSVLTSKSLSESAKFSSKVLLSCCSMLQNSSENKLIFACFKNKILCSII